MFAPNIFIRGGGGAAPLPPRIDASDLYKYYIGIGIVRWHKLFITQLCRRDNAKYARQIQAYFGFSDYDYSKGL